MGFQTGPSHRPCDGTVHTPNSSANPSRTGPPSWLVYVTFLRPILSLVST